MFHIERDFYDDDKLYEFIRSLGPETIRQFDQFNSVYSANGIRSLIADRYNFFGMLDDELIAYGFLQKLKNKNNVVSLGMVMSDKHHGHGYGRQMYEHVINWGLERYIKIWSAVYEDNDRVLHIHKSLGFELEGVFVDELNDGRAIFSVAKFRDKRRMTRRWELTRKWRILK